MEINISLFFTILPSLLRFLLVHGFSLSSVSRTSTGKVKVIAEVVLGLPFADNFGLPHGHLAASNILFNFAHDIQTRFFPSNALEKSESGSEEAITVGESSLKDGHRK
jgi:hypothetical protein